VATVHRGHGVHSNHPRKFIYLDKSTRSIKDLNFRILAKSSITAGKLGLFQIVATRLQKYFQASTRLWRTNSLLKCPRLVSFGPTRKHLGSVVTNSPSNYLNSIGNSVTFSLFKIAFQ